MSTSPLTNRFSLRDSLALVLPHLSEALASVPVIEQVQALSHRLLPIPRALLECHLGSPARRVDVSQCVFPAERDWFAAYVHAQTDWQPIAAFADDWLNPASPLADGVENVWLEFDTGGSHLPGVFVKLRIPEYGQPALDQWQTAEAALKTLLPGNTACDNLRHYFEAADGMGVVTHIGVMLSRSSDFVRINMAVESPAAALDYLNGGGWPGLPPPFAALFQQVFDLTESPTLTFDAGTTIQPRIGLECVPGHRFLLGEGWKPFFDWMTVRGLCSPEAIMALRAWPGYSDPTTADEWPLYLMLRTLAQPTPSLDVLIRQLNHIKLVFQPGMPLIAAKAYLGYSHENINPADLSIRKNGSTQGQV